MKKKRIETSKKALGTLVVKFYMDKAKAENLQKIKRDCNKDA